MTDPNPVLKSISLPRAAVMGAALVVADAFWLNQGAVALLVGLWVLLVGLPRSLLAEKFLGVRRKRAAVLAIYLFAVVLVWACNWANNQLAKRRAEIVIAAVKSYHAENRRYPPTLEDLAPRYLDSVPRAKYTLAFNDFIWNSGGESAWLQYVALPPFGRPTYDFAKGAWGYVD
jgi:hypothetical protein